LLTNGAGREGGRRGDRAGVHVSSRPPGFVARLGATPVFCDIDPATFNVDPEHVRKKITKKTKVIMPVHLFGQCANMDAINEIAQQHNGIVVIEDAAQAIGATRNGKSACSLGFAGCLSFYPTKNLGAFGDAGAICASNDAFAERCRKLRVHGSGHTYHHEMIGGMFRLAAIQAAVLEVKLKYLNDWHEARRRHATLYNKLFAGTKITPPPIETGNRGIYNQYVVSRPR
jgi:dTDP-4-amino-4,6-dideoxygalactose transaminase